MSVGQGNGNIGPKFSSEDDGGLLKRRIEAKEDSDLDVWFLVQLG